MLVAELEEVEIASEEAESLEEEDRIARECHIHSRDKEDELVDVNSAPQGLHCHLSRLLIRPTV